MRVADGSKVSGTAAGFTWETPTPYGTRTSSASMWKSRVPDRAAVRSSTATTSPGSSRPMVPEGPRSRTSTVSGGLAISSRLAGRLWYSSGTRIVRSTAR